MAKVFVKSMGCSNNMFEGQLIEGMLDEAGYEIVKYEDEADLVVINSCTVKGITKVMREVRDATSRGKKIIVGGCVTSDLEEALSGRGIGLIDTHTIPEVGRVASSVMEGRPIRIMGIRPSVKLGLKKGYFSSVISIVPISQGCNLRCTYCSVKNVKGRLVSFSPDKIINEIKGELFSGHKEIWLTSQDNGSYGFDNREYGRLPGLLNRISLIRKRFFVRVGMANPLFVRLYADELIKAYNSERIFRFLHLPVQSGSDAVLLDMKRGYRVSAYEQIVNKFRKAYPLMTFSTDIICGFPTETRADFEKSMELVQRTRPDVVNISRFVPRPGTEAYSLKPIQGSEVKNRSRELSLLHHELSEENNKRWINWEGEVLIDERGKNGTFIARNSYYKPIIISGDDISLGQFVRVRITDSTAIDLKADLV